MQCNVQILSVIKHIMYTTQTCIKIQTITRESFLCPFQSVHPPTPPEATSFCFFICTIDYFCPLQNFMLRNHIACTLSYQACFAQHVIFQIYLWGRRNNLFLFIAEYFYSFVLTHHSLCTHFSRVFFDFSFYFLSITTKCLKRREYIKV